ncbi:angiopoietin-related protein 7-like [Physella acuta]|uniref:angiopoietin-related protein 7-like n=1 Tax=Physella acuta TaxID=109671 RepID=UPI0027DD4DAE|nr:angiopoietin-related protein 7-like [Physella acuta]
MRQTKREFVHFFLACFICGMVNSSLSLNINFTITEPANSDDCAQLKCTVAADDVLSIKIFRDGRRDNPLALIDTSKKEKVNVINEPCLSVVNEKGSLNESYGVVTIRLRDNSTNKKVCEGIYHCWIQLESNQEDSRSLVVSPNAKQLAEEIKSIILPDILNEIKNKVKEVLEGFSESIKSVNTSLTKKMDATVQDVLKENDKLAKSFNAAVLDHTGVCSTSAKQSGEKCERGLVSVVGNITARLESMSTASEDTARDAKNSIGNLAGKVETYLNEINKQESNIILTATCSKFWFPCDESTNSPKKIDFEPRTKHTSVNNTVVLCDAQTDGGRWTVIQRRTSEGLDMNRTWEEYRDGFGDVSGDFWLGNQKIHLATSQVQHELMVVLRLEDTNYYAKYAYFKLLDESNDFTLDIAGHSGTAGDSLLYHKGMPFSTWDRDNDKSNINCAEDCGGGWWFKSCKVSNLNEKWPDMQWLALIKDKEKLPDLKIKMTEMKIRPKQ